MRRLLLGVVTIVAALAAICVVRAVRLKPYQAVSASPDTSVANAVVSTTRLQAAIRFATISTQNRADFDPNPFFALHGYLQQAFPLVSERLTREVVADYSLLYTWTGSDPSLEPVLLMGHLDVVPVEKGTESRWTHPPFEGAVADGYIWGRGALDDKAAAIAILESVELLLGQGFQPRRTIYLAFGHDEEIGGYEGAERLARLVESRTPKLRFLLDEGGMVAQGVVPGVTRAVALIGVVEKAALNVQLTVEGAGGHSSVPPHHTAVGVLSRAIQRLEDNPMPAHLTPVTGAMFSRLAADMPFLPRAFLANQWLLKPLLVAAMSRDPAAAATLRTTTAATMISGSPKSNVLPIVARAIVNFRILPGETPDDVLAHVRRVIADTSVHVSVEGKAILPSPVADYGSPEFGLLERTIGQLFPGAVPVPFLMVGGTDTRHYESLTRNVFRFNPFVITPELISGAHGTNERIRTEDFAKGVRLYAQLIRNAQ